MRLHLTRKRIITGLIAVIAALAIIGTGLWLGRFLAIDSCLDDGGRWNYDRDECECTYKELGVYGDRIEEATLELCS